MLMNQLGMGSGLAGQLKSSIDPEVVAHYRAKILTNPESTLSALGSMPGVGGAQLRKQVLGDPQIQQIVRGHSPLSMRAKDEMYKAARGAAVEAVPPAYMGIDEDMGVLNELQPTAPGPNAVYDPNTGEYLGEYEFMPQDGLLYR